MKYPAGETSFGRKPTRADMSLASASAPGASLVPSGRRAPRGGRAPSRVVPSAFGFGRSNHAQFTLEQIEAEIRSAPPSTSPASTSRLSLADAVWKVSLDNPLSLRDRAACAIAAEAVQALCETGLDGASLAVTLGIREAMIANGFGDSVRAVAGYVSVGGYARAHAWLEIDGRVLDVAGEGLALCEAARRLGVDYSDAMAMAEAFGLDALRFGGHEPNARRPLLVLNMSVPTGGTSTALARPGLTMREPPANVPGCEDAAETNARFAAVLSEPRTRLSDRVREMPEEVADVFYRVASTRLDLVGDERQRAARLAAGAQ